MSLVADCPDDAALRQLLLGKLADAEMAPLSGHLLACPACAARASTLDADDALTLSLSEFTTQIGDPEDPLVEKLRSTLHHLGNLRPVGDADQTQTIAAPSEPSLAEQPAAPLAAQRNFAFLAPAQAADELGRLGPYRILKVLGQGGMGVVFQAEDPRLSRRCALKVMLPEIALRPGMKERFLREARAAAQIEHDQIIPIYQVDEDRGVPYIAMPFLKGSSLEDWLRKKQTKAATTPVTIAEILKIGRQVAEGLAAAHERGLIHRDIKPANVWLESVVRGPLSVVKKDNTSPPTDHGPRTTDFRIKILDFGLARLSETAGDEQLTQSGAILGTPSYMAPEQARGEAIDGRADLFSLGVILYRMCTGGLPFKGKDTLSTLLALAAHDPEPPHVANPAVPRPLSNLVMKLLAKDREQRTASAHELIATIDALEAPTGAASPAKNGTSPRRRRLAFAAMLLPLAALSAYFGPAVYRIATNQGQVIIEANDPHVEVRITDQGEQIQIIDLKTGGQVNLKAGKYQAELTKGQGLQLVAGEFTLERGGRHIVRVRPAPTAAAAARVDESGATAAEPFVVLDGKSQKEHQFPSLAEAVAWATSGDTIEVRGNGPFICSPIDLKDTALTIRAAANCRPVFKVSLGRLPSLDAGRTFTPLLHTSAPLVLEGLELERDDRGRVDDGQAGQIIYSTHASLCLANCRLVMWKKNAAVLAMRSPQCEARNCQFLAVDGGNILDWVCPSGGQMVLDNNVISGAGDEGNLCAATFHQREPDLRGVAIRVSHNTTTAVPFWFLLDCTPPSAPAVNDPSKSSFRLESIANVFDGRAAVMDFEQAQALHDPQAKPVPAAEAEALLRRLVDWREQTNVYPAGKHRFVCALAMETKPSMVRKLLGNWYDFWGVKVADSLQGRIRYQGGDVRAKLAIAPETVMPEDFRLHADSSGYRAAAGGTDLGADVDLVGPGPAYERWKKTSAYQEWLETTGQLKGDRSLEQPFAILAREGRIEKRHPSLADAVKAAHTGDTIQIHGNGPFVCPPIELKDKALTIRAADGAWPVLSLAPEAVQADLPFIVTQAALTLEGLEFHRDGIGKPDGSSLKHIDSWGAPLALANCRFVRRAKVRSLLAAVDARKSPSFMARNCVFLGDWHSCLSHEAIPDSRLVVANCLQLGGSRALMVSIHPSVSTASVQLLHNTLIGSGESVCFDFHQLQGPQPAQQERTIRLEARQNVCAPGFLQFFYRSLSKETEDFLAREHRALVRQSFVVEEHGNRCPTDARLVNFTILAQANQHQTKPSITSPQEWSEFWKLAATDLTVGPIRFQKDLAFDMPAPDTLIPQDFRLQDNAAANKNLGADVDLVGPGPAYDKWKTTDAYRQWLDDTGQLAATPFVALAQDGRAERRFATLAEALATAQGGDTIEIRGNGPFVSEPVPIDKPLTIRAGKGFRPVMDFSAAAVRLLSTAASDQNPNLLSVRAALVLEGLEFRCNAGTKGGAVAVLIFAQGGVPLRFANCRFITSGSSTAVASWSSQRVAVRNCEFLADRKPPLEWTIPKQGQCSVENCLFAGQGIVFHYHPERVDCNVEFTRNSFFVANPIWIRFWGVPTLPAKPAPVRFRVSKCVLNTTQFVLSHDVRVENLPPAKVVEAIPQILSWNEQDNVYSENVPFLDPQLSSIRQIETLAQWQEFLHMDASTSRQGAIRFQGGDLARRVASGVETVAPHDFRLAEGSAGKSAAPDGQDLGANIDLVGPGAAYERWQQTPEYQQWLDEMRSRQP